MSQLSQSLSSSLTYQAGMVIDSHYSHYSCYSEWPRLKLWRLHQQKRCPKCLNLYKWQKPSLRQGL